MLYSAFDKIDLEFNRNDEKNEWLKKNRDVSFEEVVSVVISEDDLVKIISNPNQKKYPGQKIYVIKIRGYIHMVPYEKVGNEIYLKTIYPSRKAQKIYS